MLREIVLFYPEMMRILCIEMIKSCKSSQHTEPSPCVTTTHGQIRIGERGLTQREYNLLKASKNIKTQADGAKVYIRAINSNNHNVLVENDLGKIITFITKVTKHELRNLARNYGWY